MPNSGGRGLRRVVVTGIGMLCALGRGKDLVFSRLLKGEVGVTAVQGPGYEKVPCKVAAFVPKSETPNKPDDRTATAAVKFALAVADEALQDSRWHPETDEDRDRTGVAMGVGMVHLEEIVDAGVSFRQNGYSKVSPHLVPRILTNMAAGHVSIRHGLRGPNHAAATACATGAHAVGDAFRMVRYGDADVMLCGGSEACVGPLAMAAFCRMRALSTRFNDNPVEASRPFDTLRDGFVMGEGAAALVLEEISHALNRGAKIYAEVLGYGLSGDAHHVTAPSDNGRGAVKCMQAALRDAGVRPQDVGYVNAHATSTPLGDAAEARAVNTVFRDARSSGVAVSSTKGAVGHLLGAAGALEAGFTVMAVHGGVIPPTANLTDPGIGDVTLDLVAGEGRVWKEEEERNKRRIAVTNSFGFGGTNACLCFGSLCGV